jgi:hypothetical protein
MKMNKVDYTQQNIVPLLKDGLPSQAFAIVEDPECPSTWYLPHHTGQIKQAIAGKRSIDSTVDLMLMGKAIVTLSRPYIDGKCIASDKRLLFEGARHLVSHYRAAGRRVPNALRICLIMFGLE